MDPGSLKRKLAEREGEQRLRKLQPVPSGVDFFSNDYLGIVRDGRLEESGEDPSLAHGSTGSRLLGGNHPLTETTEKVIAGFHNGAAALLFNSGYDANLGLLSSVPGRGDTILYDQLSHASLRDGARLSLANSFSFLHNDPTDLERLLQKATAGAKGNCYVVTESVFSMDGDRAPLQEIAACCTRFNAFLIVDEAHALGVAGAGGAGWVQSLGLEDSCFARIYTFGKAAGCHGAVVIGSVSLRDYLVNFCRSFIYTTALPPVSVDAIARSYRLFPELEKERVALHALIGQFSSEMSEIKMRTPVMNKTDAPDSPIQAVIIPGNARVLQAATILRENGMAVYPVFSPTVAPGSERLRIILHSFNTKKEVTQLTTELKKILL